MLSCRYIGVEYGAVAHGQHTLDPGDAGFTEKLFHVYTNTFNVVVKENVRIGAGAGIWLPKAKYSYRRPVAAS